MKNIITLILYKIYSFYKYRERDFQKQFYSEYYLKKIYNYGENCELNGKIEILSPESLHLGSNVHIGNNAFFDCRGGLIIGDHTHISRNVTIYTTNHYYEGESIPYDNNLIPGNVKIGEGVWIGMNVSILPGINIGKGAILGMGSVISKDVEEGAIVVSQKQRIISNRNMDSFNEKFNNQLFGGVNGNRINNKNWESISLIEKRDIGQDSQICFVFSTGRSGSNSIASLLNNYNGIDAFHEPFYSYLKILSANYLTKKIDEEYVMKELIKVYSLSKTARKNVTYVESDQKLVPFIPILRKIFPNSKMIWLIREPSGFVKSAKSREWFINDKPIFFKNTVIIKPKFSSDGVRITSDLIDECNGEKWEKLTQDQKLVWYWTHWNTMIKQYLQDVELSNKFIIKLEDLESRQIELLKFLGHDDEVPIKVERTNSVKKKHLNNYNSISVNNFQTSFPNAVDFYNSI